MNFQVRREKKRKRIFWWFPYCIIFQLFFRYPNVCVYLSLFFIACIHSFIHSPMFFLVSPFGYFFPFPNFIYRPWSCVCFRLTSAPAMVLIFGLPCSSATWTPSWAHLAFLPLFSFHSFQVEKLTLPPVNLAKSSFLEQRLKSREFNGIITREGSEFFKLSPGC